MIGNGGQVNSQNIGQAHLREPHLIIRQLAENPVFAPRPRANEPSLVQTVQETNFRAQIDQASALAVSADIGTTDEAIGNTDHPLQNSVLRDDMGASFDLWDAVDVVNPLHHLPVLGSLYRTVSGDEIQGPARVAGGALYGGPLGAGFATVNVVVESATGSDLTGNAFNALMGRDNPDSARALRAIQSYEHAAQIRYND